MQNPILNDRKVFLAYIGFWVFITVFHIFLLVFSLHINVMHAITDGLVANTLFAILGIGLWFPFFYTTTADSKPVNYIVNNLFACVITVGLWIGISYLILASIFNSNEQYYEFLQGSLFWRSGIGLLYFEVIILVYYLFIFIQKNKERQIKEAELRTLIKDSELSALKSQINPHFIFNSLNSISSLTIIKPEKAREMIIKLSDFLRYSVSNKEEKLTTLQDELNNLNRYLDIEKIRFGRRLIIKQQIDSVCLKQKLPGLILQPLVENAVKYGVYENTEESVINLSATCNTLMLNVTISNNYDPEVTTKKGEGIGLKNIKSRLALFYNNNDLLHTGKTQQIFEVKVFFPQK